MHIPDGYLSPQTYAPAYGVMLPLWALASSKLKKTLRTRQVPMLALGAAFSFVIMMFNIPIPFGTTGHAVGGVLVAILLGPWAAMIAVSLALIIQALMFGDGGITAIAANCLNMAVVMPFAGWGVYKLISGQSAPTSRRRLIAAAIGGYVGLNAAAITTAIMFGIQPIIAQDSAGHPLYSPFGLKVAVPMMAAEHLLIFGFVEAIVTGLAIAYIQRTDPAMLSTHNQIKAPKEQSILRKLTLTIGVLIILTPIGIYLPAKFNAGSAWGEWSANEVGKIAGHIPTGLKSLENLWHAPLPDYALRNQESAPLIALSVTYILSAIAGIALISLVTLSLKKLLVKR